MLNFFAISLIILIGILLLVFKKRSFKQLINKGNLYSVKLKKIEKIIKNFYLKKIVFFINKMKKVLIIL